MAKTNSKDRLLDRVGLSAEESASLLGISKPTMYELLNRREDPVPSFRINKRRIIPLAGLMKWAERQAQKEAQA